MLYRLIGVASMATLLALAGCSSSTNSGAMVDGDSAAATASAASDGVMSDRDARIAALEQALSDRESRISSLEGQLAMGADSGDSIAVSGAGSELFPPNAAPGECYARILTPEKYSSSEERVLVKEASERFEVIPAQYETVTERVLVKEASAELEIVPAVYGTVTEQVVVRPATSKIVEVPATYRTVTEQVLDKPASTVWKKGPASSFGGSALSETTTSTGEVMCLVEEPATYRTVKRQVIDTPASTREVSEPAVTKTVERRVVETPASTREVTIPAVYDEVTVTKLVEPAQQRRIEVPAEYRTVTKREISSAATLAWQPVLCEVNATADNVRALQSALQAKGYEVGGIDGQLGPTTLRAVNSYAKSLSIPQGNNYVPMAVLDKLGLDI
ncbi:MAG: peptidoglycan-binding domain-containing protein [Pseudomonadales bacterium]